MTVTDVLKIVRKHIRVIIILPTISIVIASVVFFYMIPLTYAPSTTLYILTKQNENQSAISYNDLLTSKLLVSDYRELALSRRVTEKVAHDFGLVNLNDFKIDVTAVSDTRVIRLTVEGVDPLVTTQIANALANEFSLSAIDIMGAENVNVVDEAQVPLVPSGPAREQNIMLAGFAGLALAIGGSIAIEMLNTKIVTAEDVEKQLNVPVLTQVGIFELAKNKR